MRHALNISKHDTTGRRFNNLDAREGFPAHGWNARFACWSERRGPADAVEQANGRLNRPLTTALAKLGRRTGNINGYHRNSDAFTELGSFRQADLLHFHIVHEEYLSAADWLRMGENKPLVWTWHDPFMLSGHCIYSMGCDGFESGCPTCPHLEHHFRVHRDRGARNLEEKREAVKQLDPLVIVASEYMLDLVQRSVYKDFLRVRVLPFGVKSSSVLAQHAAKVVLGIPEHHVVVGFRAVYSDYKGLDLVHAALQRLSQAHPELPLTIITFQEHGFCQGLSPNFQVIDAGWVADDAIQTYYAAMDFFLMPSRAEAFGLMAIEAMAAGACPVVTYGTALPELVDAPFHSICTEHDAQRYSLALQDAIFERRHHRGQRQARKDYAARRYDLNNFCKNLTALYDEEFEHHHRLRRTARS